MKLRRVRTSFNLKPDILTNLKIVASYENETLSDIVNKSINNYINFYFPKIVKTKEEIIKEIKEKPVEDRTEEEVALLEINDLISQLHEKWNKDK